MTERSAHNSRLAKAETLLALALLTDVLVSLLFSHTAITPAGKTLIKMALVIGLLGPVQSLISRVIDRSLKATRGVSGSVLSLPRVAVHACVLGGLFVCFYWSMHHELPWTPAPPRSTHQARAEPR